MECPLCKRSARKFGKNRNGSQRYRCDGCPKTFTDEATRPVDHRCLPREKLILCLRMLLEGNSIRSTERLTGVHRDTIIAAMVEAGQKCEQFLFETVRDVEVEDVQADEIWGFVGCKERTRALRGYGDALGDAWCFTAMERTTKLLIAHHVAKRTPEATRDFSEKLLYATSGRFRLSTDGFTPYRPAIADTFGSNIDLGQVVKVYETAAGNGSAVRYSPGHVIEIVKTVRIGHMEDDQICTSHAERQNLNIRMATRRMTRLTNAHSKKWENHAAALSLYFAYYNFCRVHTSLTVGDRDKGERVTRITPAQAAGLTDHTWSMAELLVRIG